LLPVPGSRRKCAELTTHDWRRIEEIRDRTLPHRGHSESQLLAQRLIVQRVAIVTMKNLDRSRQRRKPVHQ